MTAPFATHQVLNQPAPLSAADLLSSDRALMSALEHRLSPADMERVAAFSAVASLPAFQARGRLANEHLPRLATHDPYGRRLDRVEYHPAYHELMAAGCQHGLHGSVWATLAGAGAAPGSAHLARAAMLYLAAQADPGHCGVLSATHATLPTLLQSDAARLWPAKLMSAAYDPSFVPIAEKQAALLGYAVAEKQTGRDPAALLTQAAPVAAHGEGQDYILVGHKWFVSAPMSDGFVVLAQAPAGPTAFLVPRHLPDGSLNALMFLRLKPKLGLRSNATVEIELAGAVGWALGAEGEGHVAISDMETLLHADGAVMTAGVMRCALAHAIHHCTHRRTGSGVLTDQPIMRQVLADMAVDVEAASALAFALVSAFDHVADDRSAAWARLMTPVTRYWIGKVAIGLAAEAMECMGGNGASEDFPLARCYRDVAALSLSSGPGNALVIETMQILRQEPQVAELVIEDLQSECRGAARQLGQLLDRVEALLHDPRNLDDRGRAFVEALAQLAAAVTLRRHAPPLIADSFLVNGAGAGWRSYGHGRLLEDAAVIVSRAAPEADPD